MLEVWRSVYPWGSLAQTPEACTGATLSSGIIPGFAMYFVRRSCRLRVFRALGKHGRIFPLFVAVDPAICELPEHDRSNHRHDDHDGSHEQPCTPISLVSRALSRLKFRIPCRALCGPSGLLLLSGFLRLPHVLPLFPVWCGALHNWDLCNNPTMLVQHVAALIGRLYRGLPVFAKNLTLCTVPSHHATTK